MNEIELRQEAVRRFVSGESAIIISRSLKRSRQWVYYWVKRFRERSSDKKWYEDLSRAPSFCPSKTPDHLEQQVIQARKRLESQLYAQTGALSIQYDLHNLGLDPLPIWTINRILRKHGLNKRTLKPPSSNKPYPTPLIRTHQMDFVGPRYIKGDGRFYCLNIIDTETHWAGVYPIRTKSTEDITPCVIDFWKTYGIPDALQMDNELAFRGSNKYPRSFGMIVRLSLSQEVIPVFIPDREPWRNGVIEKFNNTFDKRFFRSQSFKNFQNVVSEAPRFSSFHNHNHRYSANNGLTPLEMTENIMSQRKLSLDFELITKPKLVSGIIQFIRFIRSDLKLHLPTEYYSLGKELIYSYVIAEIDIENHLLNIKHENKIVKTIPYSLPET